jgi:hypothetical protein
MPLNPNTQISLPELEFSLVRQIEQLAQSLGLTISHDLRRELFFFEEKAAAVMRMRSRIRNRCPGRGAYICEGRNYLLPHTGEPPCICDWENGDAPTNSR